ncbi:UDP-N-acetylmuramate--L-alanine ligase [Synechococcales cyanobacterium C]|uniref:UDP-N-acetylmuramate--L-alanine ligase n=1 Tax=Petrachloros mirabilis ULC683 TaxID=2781853 RepID=A0A8K2AGX4_9CYAN|nr:UDP-N-acetylmuramate--L-alanine ligase [Petrachloros mirabilis]NCJ05704.1 UDP-N-acetylmuramate--L-alanine ligase [Petrachloros mirabilis ULC683]
MTTAVDLSGRPFHFIGVGGIGMSALAYVLAKRQVPVSGSDIRASHLTQQLQELGTQVFLTQSAANLKGDARHLNPRSSEQFAVLPQVICSTAIQDANPEYQAAVQMGCPIYHRSDLLAALIAEAPCSIAVAGTHGKTTTSSLIGYTLLKVGLDPTIIVGGEVAAWKGNARVGNSPYLVAEADESDGSLVKFRPQIGVITNVELDHPDHYQTLDAVVDVFQTFARRCQTVVVSLDCETIRDRILSPLCPPHFITYSLDPNSGADYTVDQVCYGSEGTTAQLIERGVNLGQLQLQLLGQHNLSNALAAVAVARHLGTEFSSLVTAITSFRGAQRRFELRGEAHGIRFIDDYAHHPSEVRVTLASARLQVKPGRREYPHRVVAVFQPHRYSRIHTFLDDFSQSFGDADQVVVTDIYSAGESNHTRLNGDLVSQSIATHHPQVTYQPTLAEVSTYLEQHLQPGDLVIFLGAGSLNSIISDLVTFFEQLESMGHSLAEAVA